MSSPVFEVVYQTRHPMEAEILLQSLKGAGIEAHMNNYNMTATHPTYSQFTGGIQIKVISQDADRARQILINKTKHKRQCAPCPNCGGKDYTAIPLSGFYLIVFCLLLGIPLFFRKNRKCTTCGTRW